MLLGLSMIPFFWNVYITARHGKKVTVDDPWGFGGSLEWATSCPPPRHNFDSMPRIRSERPAFDLHHPEVANMDLSEPNRDVLDSLYAGPEVGGRENLIDRRSREHPDPRQRGGQDSEGGGA